MENLKSIAELAREMKNQKAKDWRANNKDRVREINKRYWEKKAKEYLKNKEKED